MRPTNPLRLGRDARPTKAHRPAVWENMLGTVWARNDEGETRYFDYDWDGAVAFAGVSEDRDPRTATLTETVARNLSIGDGEPNPRKGRKVLFIRKV